MKNMLLFGTLTLALVFTPLLSPAAQLFQPPSLATGCWKLTFGFDVKQLVLSDPYTYHVKFRANGDKFIGRLTGPEASTVDLFEAAVFKGTSVFYVSMNQYGQSPGAVSPTANAYHAVYAGIADSATHITGTWIDMRGSMSQEDLQHPTANQAQIAPGRTIVLPIQSGWYTMENTPCSK